MGSEAGPDLVHSHVWAQLPVNVENWILLTRVQDLLKSFLGPHLLKSPWPKRVRRLSQVTVGVCFSHLAVNTVTETDGEWRPPLLSTPMASPVVPYHSPPPTRPCSQLATQARKPFQCCLPAAPSSPKLFALRGRYCFLW